MPPRTLYRTARRRKATHSGWFPEPLRQYFVRFIKRIEGGAVMATAIALFLALYSYHHLDPSLNSAAANAKVHNWLGIAGSYTADILWQVFGAASFSIVLVIFIWGWLIARQKEIRKIAWRIVSLLALMILVAAGLSLLQAYLKAEGATEWGGFIGKKVSSFAVKRIPIENSQPLLAGFMFIIALVPFYFAAAVSFEEWHSAAGKIKDSLEDFFRFLFSKLLTLFEKRSFKIFSGKDYLEEEEKEFSPLEDKEEIKKESKTFSPSETGITSRQKPKVQVILSPARAIKQPKLPLNLDSSYKAPPLDLLQWPESAQTQADEISNEALEKNAKLLESVLSDFGVYGHISKVSPGPVVTLYELEPSPGTRSSRVISLSDDIARNMSAVSARIAVLPGRNVIGIELPNRKREIVYLRELLSSPDYVDFRATLPLVLGKEIDGNILIKDLARMPHLLIAGTTGSGKSVALNSMILSLIYRLSPEKCRFIMIDPKMLELSLYEGIPHLLTPVVTEPKKAVLALKWAVREMEERYRAISKLNARDLEGYNKKLIEAAKKGQKLTRTVQTGYDPETGKPIYEEQPLDLTPLPRIVIIVDEMADLMMVAGKEIEAAVQRLSQMARAGGIHLIMATQRPSVDVITGTIKANFPTRISFQVTSRIDSRTILGEQGAEQLLGHGDMLFMESGMRVKRVHGPFVSDHEVEDIVKFLKDQGKPEYIEEITEDESDSIGDESGSLHGNGSNELYDKAVEIVLRERKASISFVQRHLQIGYNRAATLIERMEKEGIIGPANHVGKREILGRKS